MLIKEDKYMKELKKVREELVGPGLSTYTKRAPDELDFEREYKTKTVSLHAWRRFFKMIGNQLRVSKEMLGEAANADILSFEVETAEKDLRLKISEIPEVFVEEEKSFRGNDYILKSYYCTLTPDEVFLLIIASLGNSKAQRKVIDWLGEG